MVASAMRSLSASYTPVVDYSLLALTPTTDSNKVACLAKVPIQLTLTGSIVGTVDAAALVHVDGPCASVVAGEALADAFFMSGDFAGFIQGKIATGKLSFAGLTSEGGIIKGKMVLEGPYFGSLMVEGLFNVGGTYEGSLESVVSA